MRTSKHIFYLNLAYSIAEQGSCLRRNYGAVIVKNDRVVSTGYTGSPRGTLNCCNVGKCTREEQKIPQGQRYDLCRSIHAEQNAIIQCYPDECIGADMYVGGLGTDGNRISIFPCDMCKRFILNAQIKSVIISSAESKEGYSRTYVEEIKAMLHNSEFPVSQFSLNL